MDQARALCAGAGRAHGLFRCRRPLRNIDDGRLHYFQCGKGQSSRLGIAHGQDEIIEFLHVRFAGLDDEGIFAQYSTRHFSDRWPHWVFNPHI